MYYETYKLSYTLSETSKKSTQKLLYQIKLSKIIRTKYINIWDNFICQKVNGVSYKKMRAPY